MVSLAELSRVPQEQLTTTPLQVEMSHEERFAQSAQDGTSPVPEEINSPQPQVGTSMIHEEQPANLPQANQEVVQDGTSPGPEEINLPQLQVGTSMVPEEQPANLPQANQEIVQDGTSRGPEEINLPQLQVGTSMAPEDQPANLPQANQEVVQDRTSPGREEINSLQPQEALKKRVQLFSEGLVKMASLVLLALTMKKENIFFRGSISLFAAIILGGGILLFVWLWLSSLLAGGLRRVMYSASKLLVYLCGMVVVALASNILLLISMDTKPYLAVLIPFFILTILSCCWSMHLDENQDSRLYGATQREAEVLEISVDFAASITTHVFLGLGRFALEIGGKGSDHLADLAVGIFFICVLGVFFTLCGTIPLPSNEGEELVRPAVEFFDILLALAVSGMVFWITWVIIKTWACLLFLPPLASLFVWAFFTCSQGDQKQQEDGHQQMDLEGNQQQQQQPPGSGETKPAPLELTKATFTGFLLVAAVQSPNNGSISNCMHAFIFLTAGAVVSGLLWRFLTHRTNPLPAVVTATNVASGFAHSCLAAAVVPFAVLASKA